MKVKLHRCGSVWLKVGAHSCWRVQRELDAAGVEYEIVRGPLMRGNRADLEKLSGQRSYPVIEAADGTVYRDDPAEMAERIRSGHLLGVVHDHSHEDHMHDTESL